MDETIISKIFTFLLCLFALSVVYSVSVVEGAMFGLLALTLYTRYKAGKLQDTGALLKENPLFIPWMTYLAVSLTAAIFAIHPKAGLAYFPSDLIKYVCLATLFIVCKPPRLEKAINYYVFGALLIGLIGTVQAISAAASGLDIRASSFMNAVRYGEIMAIALTFITARLMAGQPGKDKPLYFAGGVITAAALILSQTRGAYLGFAAALFSMLIFGKGLRVKLLKLGLILVLMGGATIIAKPEFARRLATIADGFSHALTSTAKPVNGSESDRNSAIAINTRLELWKTGMKMIKDHPVLGIGTGNVKDMFPIYYKEPFPEGKQWGSLHSIYIQHTAERGLIGLAALLFLFSSMFVLTVKNIRKEVNPFTLWAVAVLPAYFVINLTEVSFQHIHTSFAVFLALAASHNSVNKNGV